MLELGADKKPTTSSTDETPGAYSEPNAKALGKAPLDQEGQSGPDSAKIIEGAEIAPLGEGKIADDPSVTSTASSQACESKFIFRMGGRVGADG
jgi:hypothetical protein